MSATFSLRSTTVPPWDSAQWAMLPPQVSSAFHLTFDNTKILQENVDCVLAMTKALSTDILSYSDQHSKTSCDYNSRLCSLEHKAEVALYRIHDLDTSAASLREELASCSHNAAAALEAQYDRIKLLVDSALSGPDNYFDRIGIDALLSRVISAPLFQEYMKAEVSTRFDTMTQMLDGINARLLKHDSNFTMIDRQFERQACEIALLKKRIDALERRYQDVEELQLQVSDAVRETQGSRDAFQDFVSNKFATEVSALHSECSRVTSTLMDVTQSMARNIEICESLKAADDAKAVQCEIGTKQNVISDMRQDLMSFEQRFRNLEFFSKNEFRTSLARIGEDITALRDASVKHADTTNANFADIARGHSTLKEWVNNRLLSLEKSLLDTGEFNDNRFVKMTPFNLLRDNVADLAKRVDALSLVAEDINNGRKRRNNIIEGPNSSRTQSRLPATFSGRISYAGDSTYEEHGASLAQPLMEGHFFPATLTNAGETTNMSKRRCASAKPIVTAAGIATGEKLNVRYYHVERRD